MGGFVFAPFAADAGCPTLLFGADDAETCMLPQMESLDLQLRRISTVDEERASYAGDFRRFHEHLLSSHFQKLVLSRSSEWIVEGEVAPEHLFFHACRAYPDAFVALVKTPNHGTWLMSTPEVLLRTEGRNGYTMALAGTILATEQPVWTDKNREEQRLVADYIARTVAPFSEDTSIGEPQTVRAANVMHLQTDIRFTLRDDTAVANLLDELHPTPAVCGLPKAEARQFILANEHAPRLYYSGFCGLFDMNSQTALYVSLRCMQILDNKVRLYAGGGLLRGSMMESEWQETEAKMETMLGLLQ
ncbi:MAG: isochorismate synthase [Prevotella sp.]|nr:isochorismate synthase [Prevotella sp.]